MSFECFDSALGAVMLQCPSPTSRVAPQPWDGADRLLLERLSVSLPATPMLVVNDRYGAITVSLHRAGVEVTAAGDSWLARQALQANLAGNQADADTLRWRWSDQLADAPPPWVLMRVPASLALLRYQLSLLVAQASPGTRVLIASMDKHCPRNLRQVMSVLLEDVGQFRGKYKAHVYQGTVARSHPFDPDVHRSHYPVPGLALPLIAEAGVFAQQQLDIGARQLLDQIPYGLDGELVDLGCGAGVLGLVAAARNPAASVSFHDESRQALRSVRANLDALFPGRVFRCEQGDGVCGRQADADLVLLNPPFHRGTAVDAQVGYGLVEQAAQVLRPGGTLRMVVNRHLDYRPVLRRCFSAYSVLAGSPKFVVFQALR